MKSAFFLFISLASFAGTPAHPGICKSKSARLQILAQEDQADRAIPYEQIDWNKVAPRDLERRKEVATIFAEGCFKSAEDFAAAALIFQHGDVPEHFFQAFLWANKAVELGKISERWLAGAALDRYLVKSGRKQLFGTQFSKDQGSALWCVEGVEETFPDSRRVEDIGVTLRESVEIFLRVTNSGQTFEQTPTCRAKLKPSPMGTVPGFW